MDISAFSIGCMDPTYALDSVINRCARTYLDPRIGQAAYDVVEGVADLETLDFIKPSSASEILSAPRPSSCLSSRIGLWSVLKLFPRPPTKGYVSLSRYHVQRYIQRVSTPTT